MDKEELKKIAGFGENNIGPTEENVKQKIVVPLLVLLGHRRDLPPKLVPLLKREPSLM